MCQSAEAAFAEFIERLRPGAEELRAARAIAVGAAEVLRRHFRAGDTIAAREDHLVAGSFGKRTAIRPLPRVDLYYVLPQAPHGSGLPSWDTALAESAAALTSVFHDVSVESWRVLTPVVAVIPCLEEDGAFLIPGPKGWRLSNPAAEASALRLGDDLTGGRLIQLLALMKSWQRWTQASVSGFALEVLTREFVTTAEAAPLPRLFADCLAWARRHTPAAYELPGGRQSLDIGAEWHALAEAAYWRCVLAERKAAAGEMDAALAEWSNVLGPNFMHTTKEKNR